MAVTIKKIEVFEDSDGRTYDTLEQALAAEQLLTIANLLEDDANLYWREITAGEVAMVIVEHSAKLIEILNTKPEVKTNGVPERLRLRLPSDIEELDLV